MNPMIHRVAQVLASFRFRPPYHDLDTMTPEARKSICDEAMSVIAAMRKPTPPIERIVAHRAWHSGSGIDPGSVWEAAIGAACDPWETR